MDDKRKFFAWVFVYCLLAAVVVLLTRTPQKQFPQQSPKLDLPTLSRVIDGDTVVLNLAITNQIHVRLTGIDAPERGQPFYSESGAYLNMMLKRAPITFTSNGIDRYGRTLGTLYVGGTNVSLLMVQAGLAWHFTRYSHDLSLAAAERDARERHAGMWQSSNLVAPWEYRSSRAVK